MGWFAIACVFGFLLYRALLGVQRPEAVRTALKSIAVLLAIALVVDLLVLSLSPPRGWSTFVSRISGQLNVLGDGMVARFIFGIVLGFGFGYAIEDSRSAREQPAGRGLRPNTYMMVGLALVVLAGIAPHLDHWLSRVSGFKSSIIEIQLTSISTVHKGIMADARESFADESALQVLSDYNKLIKKDIAFVEQVIIWNLEWQKGKEPHRAAQIEVEINNQRSRLARVKELAQVFEEIISPLAGCALEAIKNGYSLENVRAMARPIVDVVHQKIILDRRPAGSSSPSVSAKKTTHKPADNTKNNSRPSIGFAEKLRPLLAKIPETIKNYWEPDSPCVKRYTAENFGWRIPEGTNYKELPYVFGALASLVLFTGDDELAHKILQKSQVPQQSRDYNLPYLQSRAMYFLEEPLVRYKSLLDEMRTMAQRDLALLDMVESRCQCDAARKETLREARKRARRLELIALNNTAYGVAQDLAARIKSAEPFEAIAHEYAERLAAVVDGPEITDEAERDGYRDTIAFVALVAEARKSVRDSEKIKSIVKMFEQIVAHKAGPRQDGAPALSKLDRALMRISRAHLSSALELQP